MITIRTMGHKGLIRVFREFVELVIVVLIVVVAAAAVAAAAVVVIVVVVVVVVSGRDRGVHPTYRCWGYTL
ncbi:hypothetical protein V1477_014105 [Vespula maculifrons]|uniref:Uncharacterized protein n=1 Tax=Vespula maculifrons TaxID=7453 RepID=A0ABD2BK31_VESMC